MSDDRIPEDEERCDECDEDGDEDDGITDEVEIVCPFCGRCVLWDCHRTGGFDGFDVSFCEHVCYANTWAYDLLDGKDTAISTGDNDLNIEVEDYLDEHGLGGSDCLEEIGAYLKSLFKREGISVETRHCSEYFECGAGPNGGGPTYSVVFVRRLQ